MTVKYIDAVSEQVPDSNSTVYTAPDAVKSAHIIFGNCNCEDATGTTVTVNIVKSGETVAVTNEYITDLSIASGASDPLTEIIGAVLKPGDFVSVVAADADKLNLKLGIKEIY